MTDLLIVDKDDIMLRYHNRDLYKYHIESLEKYIPWIKEQICKSKEGYIRIKRGDLITAMKKELEISMGDNYRYTTVKSLYKIIRATLFSEEIFVELDTYDREKVFIMRHRTSSDCLIPSIAKLEKLVDKKDDKIKLEVTVTNE